jgi:hypothetical protein
MICHYCQQECRPIQQGPLPNGLHENRIAHCDPCNVQYFNRFHVVCCTLDGKEFSVSYMDDHPNHWTTIYHDGPKPFPKYSTNNIALSFKFHVRFTPANFKEKLKLYLLFS